MTGSRPAQRERRIVESHAPPCLLLVRSAHTVFDFRVVHERLEAVGAASRDVERAVGRAAQLDGHVPEQRRRVGTEVDDDVVDGTAHAPHQLRLGMRTDLVVHPADGSGLTGHRHVALHDRRVQAVRDELVAAERPREPAPVVLDRLEVDDHDAGDLGLGEAHQTVAPERQRPAACAGARSARCRRARPRRAGPARPAATRAHDARVFRERHRQQPGRAGDGVDLAVAAVAADPVEPVAGPEVALRDRDDVGDGRARPGSTADRRRARPRRSTAACRTARACTD